MRYKSTFFLVLLFSLTLLFGPIWAQTQTDWQTIVSQAEDRFGRKDKRYVRVLHGVFDKLFQQGNYEDAITVEEQALEAEARLYGTDSNDYAISVCNVASVSLLINKQLDKNESRVKQVLPILERDNSSSLASAYSILASIYSKQERYTEAINLYETGLQVEKAHSDRESTALPGLYNGLGMLYAEMGNQSRAGMQFAQALEIMEKRGLSQTEPLMYITIKQNLAASLGGIRKWQKGATLLEDVLERMRKLVPETHPRYFPILLNLTYFHVQLDHNEKALALLKRYKTAFDRQASVDPFHYANLLNSIGSIEMRLTRNDDAASTLSQALSTLDKADNKISSFKLGILENWCYSQWRLNNTTAVANRLPELTSGLLDRLFNVFTVSSEGQRQRVIEQETNSLDFHRSFLFANPSLRSLAELIYDEELAIKEAVLGSNRQLSALLRSITDPAIKNEVENWLTLRAKLSSQQQTPPAQQNPDLNQLDIQVSESEERLIRKSAVFRQFRDKQMVKWRAVRAGLLPNEAAVEFVTFSLRQPTRWTDSTMYAALVLRPGFEQPLFVPLCEERKLRRFLQPVTSPVIGQAKPGKPITTTGANTASTRGGEVIGRQAQTDSLYRIIWQPLDSLLNGVRVVYYSPAGLLHKVPFFALTKKGTLLGNQYTLHQLASSRTLAARPNPFRVAADATVQLYGAIDYNRDPSGATPATESAFLDGDTLFKKTVTVFKELPGTRSEVDTIQLLLSNRTVVHRGDQATEESVKALAPANVQVLHIATHGYFLPSSSEEQPKEVAFPSEMNYQPAGNPMLRSGLIMAGGNTTWQSGKRPKTGDDGILTAFEIAQLDFSQTELVTLSACETGLGDIRNFEGVFGLQRAFKQAGAKRLLMSLQKISDKATVEFMAHFYKTLLRGFDVREAFVTTQRAMQKLHPTQAAFWANFILVE